MKKSIASKGKRRMRKEYDFSGARPNKYAKKYAQGTNIVLIEPDLFQYFPDSESVNNALRALVSIIPKSKQGKPKRSPASQRRAMTSAR